MRKILIIFGIMLVAFSCKNQEKGNTSSKVELADHKYTAIGEEILADNAKSTKDMSETYKSMAVGDTISAKMIGKVDEVCQSRGCWMKIDLEDGEQVMVKFKDYALLCQRILQARK